REQAGPLADQEQVRRPLHDAAGERGDVAHVLDGGDGPGAERLAVHHAGVELHGADAVAQAAEADGADVGIVLDRLRPRERRVERRAARLQQRQGGAGGDLSELPGGDDDGGGHGASSSMETPLAASREAASGSFAAPPDPARPPMPPDDPAAHYLGPNPQKLGHAGIARIEGTGYLDLLVAWDAENRLCRKAMEAEAASSDEPGIVRAVALAQE